MLELVTPSELYRSSFLEAALELEAEGEPAVGDADFSALLQRYADYAAGRVPAGRVADSNFWLVEGPQYIGRVSVRHALNDALRVIGGHIGYGVRPSRRRQGHGHRLLALALPRAHALGIDPALVTCDDANVASWRIIERCGGVLATDVVVPGVRRYWVPTAPG